MRRLIRSICPMSDLRLVIFDVDGTLVDSQAEIMAAMQLAYAAEGEVMPTRQQVLSIVGLSLPEAFARLSPTGPVARLVQGYREAFNQLRGPGGTEASPLFPGALDILRQLQAEDETLLAVATGKSRRGLNILIAKHGLQGVFISQQVADSHPSKPHPSMVEACLALRRKAPAGASSG